MHVTSGTHRLKDTVGVELKDVLSLQGKNYTGGPLTQLVVVISKMERVLIVRSLFENGF